LGSTPAISRANLDLTAAGDSAGEVEAVFGALITVRLVTLADGSSYLELPGQGWVESGLLSEQYDTTAILDPARGLPKLLSSGTDAVTKGSEQINGTDAWKISMTFSTAVVEALVPAQLPEGGLTGDVWIAKDTKMLLKSVMNAPATDVSPPAVITMTLTNFNAPVDIRAPIS
jgi:lipoprotein LprG